MSALALPNARTIFERASGRRILVIGDLMIDEWIWGTVTRISPEAPVPVVAVADHSFTLGGARQRRQQFARACAPTCALPASVGDDAFGVQIRAVCCTHKQVDDDGVVTVGDRPTTRKTRVVAHNQQVVRADWESTAASPQRDRAAIADFVRRRAPQCDAVIISDYAKGLISREIVEAAAALRARFGRSQTAEHRTLCAASRCVAPNAAEAASMTGIAIRNDDELRTRRHAAAAKCSIAGMR